MRNHFSVQLKDLAWKKRCEAIENPANYLVCVPDATLQTACKADVYAIGFLILQLVLGTDLLRVPESELQRIETCVVNLTPDLLGLVSSLFSGELTVEQTLDHPFFTETAHQAKRVSVQITFDTSNE